MFRYVLPLVALILSGAAAFAGVPLALALLVPAAHAEPAPRTVAITVNGGYTPDRVELPAGTPARLVFTRTEYTGCTREVVFPELGIRKELPPNVPVTIDLPVLAPGTYTFRCGMDMIRGTLVVAAVGG